ncbi:MAG: hypothetical protein CMJ58_03655 [Planctomycetaceae bacterium]|nr:hypothetical protein [Planctomycetaceae bacterium]
MRSSPKDVDGWIDNLGLARSGYWNISTAFNGNQLPAISRQYVQTSLKRISTVDKQQLVLLVPAEFIDFMTEHRPVSRLRGDCSPVNVFLR